MQLCWLLAGVAALSTSLSAASSSGAPALQQETPRMPPAAPRFWLMPAAPKTNLLKNLFMPWQPRSEPSRDQQASPPKPKVVCGMLVIPVDPRTDPRMRVIVPDATTKFTIRTIQPPLCRPEGDR